MPKSRIFILGVLIFQIGCSQFEKQDEVNSALQADLVSQTITNRSQSDDIELLKTSVADLQSKVEELRKMNKGVEDQWIMWQSIRNVWSKYAVLGVKDKPMSSYDSKSECLEAALGYAEANKAKPGALSFTLTSDVRIDTYSLTCLPIHVNPN